MFRDIAGIILGKSKVTIDTKQKITEEIVFGPLQFCDQHYGIHFFNLIQHEKFIAVPMRYIGDQMGITNGFVVTGVFLYDMYLEFTGNKVI